MKTQEINESLEIVSLKGKRFPFPNGYYTFTKGHAIHVPELGYLAFECDYNQKRRHHQIYTPLGGRKALQEILNNGGFCDYEGITWVQELNFKGFYEAS